MNQPPEHAAPGPWEHYARIIGLGVFVLALGVLLGAASREPGSTERDAFRVQGKDTRVGVPLTADQRETVLKDMRTMLTAIQRVMEAAQQVDPQRMRAAAQSGGTGAALATRDAELQAALPEDFRNRAADVHADFDMLADAVRGFTARDTALVYLSRISQQCVACHAQYRLAGKEKQE